MLTNSRGNPPIKSLPNHQARVIELTDSIASFRISSNENMATPIDRDLERNQGEAISTTGEALVTTFAANNNEECEKHESTHSKWYRKLIDAGVEENGIRPVPLDERNQTQYNELFTVFFTCLLCVLP